MPHALKPHSLTQKDFTNYTANWQRLVTSSDTNSLNACFSNTTAFINYVYLYSSQVDSLLSNGAKKIRAKFALAPHEISKASVFTMAFYSTDSNDIRVSDYYLAGVAGTAADLYEEPTSPLAERILFNDASNSIKSWRDFPYNNLDFNLFTTKGERLLGYTHEAEDFQAITVPPAGETGPYALWLNFALHPEREVFYDAKNIFDTVLTRNVVPDADARGTIILSPTKLYYDVANPCPPACGAGEIAS